MSATEPEKLVLLRCYETTLEGYMGTLTLENVKNPQVVFDGRVEIGRPEGPWYLPFATWNPIDPILDSQRDEIAWPIYRGRNETQGALQIWHIDPHLVRKHTDEIPGGLGDNGMKNLAKWGGAILENGKLHVGSVPIDKDVNGEPFEEPVVVRKIEPNKWEFVIIAAHKCLWRASDPKTRYVHNVGVDGPSDSPNTISICQMAIDSFKELPQWDRQTMWSWKEYKVTLPWTFTDYSTHLFTSDVGGRNRKLFIFQLGDPGAIKAMYVKLRDDGSIDSREGEFAAPWQQLWRLAEDAPVLAPPRIIAFGERMVLLTATGQEKLFGWTAKIRDDGTMVESDFQSVDFKFPADTKFQIDHPLKPVVVPGDWTL